MTYDDHVQESAFFSSFVHTTLLAFPISCFSLTVLTDLAYLRTFNLLFLHFSEWLLLAGLVFGIADLFVRVVDLLVRRVRPPWLAVTGGIVVLLLATLNSFIHTVDGWPAVMPWGITVSILTVSAMLVTGWFGWGATRNG